MAQPAETAKILARKVDEVPLSPADAAWQAGPPYRVDLSSQKMTLPIGGGAVTALDVQALTDGRRFGVRLSWMNPKRDGNVGIRSHRDACAVMFPALPGELPPFFMGGPGKPVVVWQWKPDWEDPIAQETARTTHYPEYADYYNPSNDAAFAKVGDRPHEGRANVMVTEGFGTLTRTEDPDLQIKSAFENGAWSVVFLRPLPAQYPPLKVGGQGAMNFAVWDGGEGEVGARKSPSYEWHSFQIEGRSDEKPKSSIPGIATPGAIAAGATAAAIAWAIRRRMENARGGDDPPLRKG
ncbi:MAG: hypothetical protein HY556_04520 [Euryarchaeota archaeon]|nr:hypothetical protein [Euryarchaeota archaeon]